MLRSDAKGISTKKEFNPDNILCNNDAINNDMISEIERELQDNAYDMISLVFLLYDVPDTALQRLIVFELISKDVGNNATNLNMLHEWFQHAKLTTTWKHEFVEALLLCQLYSIVRKLGIDIPSAKNYYQTENISQKMYINPYKKALYKLCESMNADNLFKLKKTLLTYEIDTSDFDSCELVFLKLMCEKFITVSKYQYNNKTFGFQAQLDKLVKIIEGLPGLRKFAHDINALQRLTNEDARPSTPLAVSTPAPSVKVDESTQNAANPHYTSENFEDVFEMISKLCLEENSNVKSLKSDRKIVQNDCFEIKNPKRVGVCVILNIVNFYPSKHSLENANQINALQTRIGSDKDKEVLEKTMSSLNFKVYSAKDLDHKQMFDYVKEILKEKVLEEDSVFMLCILSHGVRGHVYAADSVKINMDEFQNLLDSDIAVHLRGKPKVLIVQACQENDEVPHPRLVADGPGDGGASILKKTNFLICWATAPELEAYRDEIKGSIFIQILCRILLEHVNTEHFQDIFTKVTDSVQLICEKLGCPQVPISNTTLRKKLYLQMPQ